MMNKRFYPTIIRVLNSAKCRTIRYFTQNVIVLYLNNSIYYKESGLLRKKLIMITVNCFLICLLFITFFPLTVFANESGATISLSDAQGKVGDKISVNIEISNNPGFISANLYVTYDTDILKLTKVEDGGVLSGKSHSDKLSSPYSLAWINDLSTENFRVNGKIATLYFEIISNTSSETSISLEQDIIDAKLDSVIFDVKKGKVKINSSDNQKSENNTKSADNQNADNSSESGENSNNQSDSNGLESNSSSKVLSDESDKNSDNQVDNNSSKALNNENQSSSQNVTNENGEIITLTDGDGGNGAVKSASDDSTNDTADGGGFNILVIAGIVVAVVIGVIVILLVKRNKLKGIGKKSAIEVQKD